MSKGYAGSQDALVATLAREGLLDAAGSAAGVMRSVDRAAFVPRFPDLSAGRRMHTCSVYKGVSDFVEIGVLYPDIRSISDRLCNLRRDQGKGASHYLERM